MSSLPSSGLAVPPPSGARKPGQVITFYSYKGGVGRSMALANVASLLARLPGVKGVLMLDWDLEAPGLHKFFFGRLMHCVASPATRGFDLDKQPGLIELLTRLSENVQRLPAELTAAPEKSASLAFEGIGLDQFIVATDEPALHLMTAGRFDEDYSSRVNEFRWQELYDRAPRLIGELAERLATKYDYVLVDSRTGYTDISGICTMLLPERLVVVFTPNRQSMTGVLGLIQKATNYRRNSGDLRPLVVFPLPSRIEAAEPTLRGQWRFGDTKHQIRGYQTEFQEIFKEVYRLTSCDLKVYFDKIQVQHVPRYAYGEEIAVRIEQGGDRLSLTESYQTFTEWLVHARSPWEDPAEAQRVDAEYERAATLSRTAESTFASLSAEQQNLARDALLRLVRVARKGEGEHTRKHVGPANSSAPAGPGEVMPTVLNALQPFMDAGVVTSSIDPETRLQTVQLADNTIIQHWSRLAEWIQGDREFLVWREALGEAIAKWLHSGRDDEWLLTGPALTEALRWRSERQADLTSAERLFLETSGTWAANKERRATRALRWRFVGIATAALIGTWLFDLMQRRNQEVERNAAILTAAQEASITDPTTAALLLSELGEAGETEAGLKLARDVASRALSFAVLRGHTRPITSAVFSPDGRRLATTSFDSSARIWSSDGTRDPIVLLGHRGKVQTVSFSADGRRVVTGADDSTAWVWSADGSGAPMVLPHKAPVTAAAFDPSGNWLATVSGSGTAGVWRLAEDRPQDLGRRGQAPVLAAAFPSGKYVVTVTTAGLLRWDPLKERLISRRGLRDNLLQADFSADGTRLITLSQERSRDLVEIWFEEPEFQVLQRLEATYEIFPGGVEQNPSPRATTRTPLVLGLNASGSRAFKVAASGHVYVWPPDQWNRRVVLSKSLNRGTSGSPDFLPDTASRDSASTGSPPNGSSGDSGPLELVMGDYGRVTTAAVSPDGDLLALAYEDGTTRLTRLQLPRDTTGVTWTELLAKLRDYTTACLSPENRVTLLRETRDVAESAYRACETKFDRTTTMSPSATTR